MAYRNLPNLLLSNLPPNPWHTEIFPIFYYQTSLPTHGIQKSSQSSIIKLPSQPMAYRNLPNLLLSNFPPNLWHTEIFPIFYYQTSLPTYGIQKSSQSSIIKLPSQPMAYRNLPNLLLSNFPPNLWHTEIFPIFYYQTSLPTYGIQKSSQSSIIKLPSQPMAYRNLPNLLLSNFPPNLWHTEIFPIFYYQTSLPTHGIQKSSQSSIIKLPSQPMAYRNLPNLLLSNFPPNLWHTEIFPIFYYQTSLPTYGIQKSSQSSIIKLPSQPMAYRNLPNLLLLNFPPNLWHTNIPFQTALLLFIAIEQTFEISLCSYIEGTYSISSGTFPRHWTAYWL